MNNFNTCDFLCNWAKMLWAYDNLSNNRAIMLKEEEKKNLEKRQKHRHTLNQTRWKKT